MEDELSLDMDDDEDIDSEESSKDINNKKHINDSSFTTENIVNYGKEYKKLDKIYSKKEILSFNKILDYKKLNKLNSELDLYKKEKIDWKYVYNNVFKMILLPINLNKVDINKTISIHEISQRIKYCVHCISTMKEKNINMEKNNLIPKIIDIFSNDKRNRKKIKLQNNFRDIRRSNSHQNFNFDDETHGISFENTKKNKEGTLITLNNNDDNINNNKTKDNNINIINTDNNNNNDKINENKDVKRKNKTHVTFLMSKNSQDKLFSKNPLINKDLRNLNHNIYHSINKVRKIDLTNLIIENMEKKNDAYENIIKNIPKMSDNILFEIKQKKQNIQLKRNAFLETMSDFNLKNLNMEIKDKTFCENFSFFPLKQNYDKDNDLEKRGEIILSYKKMSDNLIDLLNI